MAIGDINKIKDTLDFDTTYCDYPYIIHVAGNVYLIIYTSSSNNLSGTIATIEIIDGMIKDTVIDSYQFVANGCLYPKIIHIAGTTYCATYRGAGTDVYFMTFTITDTGQITKQEIDDATYATATWFMDIQKVATGIYLHVHQYASVLTSAITWSIAANGTLGASRIDGVDMAVSDPAISNLLTISPGVFAFCFSSGGYDLGHVKTFPVSGLGVIGAEKDILQFDDTYCRQPHLFHVADDVYAAVYDYTGPTGKIVTFTIASDGTISDSIIDFYVFETGTYHYSSVAQVATDVFVVAYTGPDTDGWLKSVKIAANGQITEPFISSFEFDTDKGETPWILFTQKRYYAIAYNGPDSHGFLKTAQISTPGGGLPHTELIIGTGP